MTESMPDGADEMFLLSVGTEQVATIMKTILRGSPKNVRANTQMWLEVHAARTVLTDIPAFLCFLLANMS